MPNEFESLNQVQQTIAGTSVERTSITASDIIELLNSSLQQGEPFASEFTERVIKPLAKKIESKINVSSIKVDGASIGEYITETLKTGSEDAVKSGSKKLADQFKDIDFSKSLKDIDLSKSFEKLDLQLKPVLDLKNLDLNKILGAQAEAADKNQMSDLRSKFLSSIGEHVDDIVQQIGEKGTFNISSLFGSDPKTDILTTWRYNRMVSKLYKEISTHSDDLVKNIAESTKTKEQGLPLSSLFGVDVKTSLWTQHKFNQVQRKLLGAISTHTDALVKQTMEGGVKLDLAGILGAPPTRDPITWWKFNRLQKSLLKSLEEHVSGLKQAGKVTEREITMGSIFGEIPSMGFLNRMRFRRIQKILLKNLEEKARDKVDLNLGDNQLVGKKSKPSKKEFSSLLESENKVTVAGFTKAALASLATIVPGAAAMAAPVANKAKDSGLISGLLGKSKFMAAITPLLGGAAVILGGLAALVGGLATGGVEKGALKIIGKGGLAVGLKMIGKKIGKTLIAKGLKRIPVVGGLISFAFAIDRFRRGDIIGGIVDVVSGLVGFLDLVVPGLGTVLSLGVDMFSAFLDAKTGGASAESSKKKAGIFKSIGKWIWDKLKKTIRYVPVIGTIIRLGESLGEMKKGNIVQGLLSFAAAFAVGMPGIGTAVAFAVDMFNSKQEKEEATAKAEGKQTIMGKFNSWLIEKVKKMTLFKIGAGLMKVFKGDIKGGLWDIAKAIGSLPVIGKPFMHLVTWAFGDPPPDDEPEAVKGVSLFQTIKDTLKRKLIASFKKSPKWLRWAMKRVPGLSGLLKDEEDIDLPDGDTSEAEEATPTRQKSPPLTGSLARQSNETEDQYTERLRKLRLERNEKQRQLSASQSAGEKLTDYTNRLEEQNATQNALPSTKPVDKQPEPQHTPDVAITRSFKKPEFEGAEGQLPSAKAPVFKVELSKDDQKESRDVRDENLALRREIRKLTEMVGNVMNLQNTQMAEKQQPLVGSTDNLPSTDSGGRDPAYLLRARVWDRLRSGVLIT